MRQGHWWARQTHWWVGLDHCWAGRVTGGWGRVTGGEGQSLPQSDTVEIQMDGMMSQRIGGVTKVRGRILYIRT